MAIQINQQTGNIAVVSVSGRLDAVTTPQYEKAVRDLISGGTANVVIDFADLEYISSAGLGGLILTSRLVKEKKGRLGVANARGNVLSVFDMCGIRNLLQIYNSVADALAVLKVDGSTIEPAVRPPRPNSGRPE